MANENKIQDIIKTSLEGIRSVVDTNTVIGDPIDTNNGTTIIPISQVAVGFASGGVDYNGKDLKKVANSPSKLQNFGGGGGTGISVTPVGFLVISKNGSVNMVNVGEHIPSDPVDNVIDFINRSPDIIDNLKELFKKFEDIIPGKSEKTEKSDK